MEHNFQGGVWPVMLTPFTKENKIDYPALKELVQWYISNKVSGLFAVCQSSEMFQLTLDERLSIASKVVEYSNGKVPVIASGHISDFLEDQITELNEMSHTGVDAVIFITNRFAEENEDDSVWIENCEKILEYLDSDIPLGLYECPYPYKRLLSPEILKWCAKSNRFYFLKDTCCDIDMIRERLEVIKGTNLKLYNANSTTLLESLRFGAAGFSGVMANFHPQLYVWICEHKGEREADDLAAYLSAASLIEWQCYPVNAKYHLREVENLKIETASRVRSECELTETYKKEVKFLDYIMRMKIKETV